VYSVALMIALTTGADAPDCHRGHRGHGCSGGCYGGYGGCYGGGGYGGCYGGGGYGGCYGGYASGGCCGYGGGYASGGCYGGYGGGYVSGVPYTSANFAQSYPQAQGETPEEYEYCKKKVAELPPEAGPGFRSGWLRMTNAERKKMMDKEPKKDGMDKEKKDGSGSGSSSLQLPAQIVVTLPADARLTIDDGATQSVGTTRVFRSPPLPQDHPYSYTLKAEFVRDGKTVSVTKTAAVSAGKETLVSFDDISQRSVASK
jgi:uncharacterized protein (TIGR03000 family)